MKPAQLVPTAAGDPPVAQASTTPDTDTDRGGAPGTTVTGGVATDPRSGHQCERDGHRELREVARLVLAGQRRCSTPPGTDLTGLDRVDLGRVMALVDTIAGGSSLAQRPTTRPELWERRIGAVAAVLGGALTRGQTGRAMQERSQDVSHWVRRHLEGIELLDADEHPERDQPAVTSRLGERGR